MTGETPIKLWDPALARRSLPNGMPITEPTKPDDATLLDERSINCLVSSASAVGWLRPRDRAYRITLHPEDAPTVFVTPSTISPNVLVTYAKLGAQIDLAQRGISVRYVATPEVAKPIGSGVTPSSAIVRASLEHVRRQLRLNARTVGRLIGLSTRRYYEFRAGEELPAKRLADIQDRVDLLSRLAGRDLAAATELSNQRTVDVAGLLSSGRLGEVEALFVATVGARATRIEPERRPTISAAEANELLAAVEGPTFGKILELVRFLAPAVDNGTAERLASALRMERNIRAVEDGAPPENEWEFLLVMRTDAIDSLRERADLILRVEAFGPTYWAAFIARESSRAWASFDYEPADPLPVPRPEETASAIETEGVWTREIEGLGISLSLFDRRTR